MLIAGRLCLGAGVGFGNQAVPLFISEIAPAKYRGGLNICFQLLITIGILIANIINYYTANLHPYGWRITLGGAAAPAIVLLVGSLVIMETPTSLVERGKAEEGLRVLKKIRGVDNVDRGFFAAQFFKSSSSSQASMWLCSMLQHYSRLWGSIAMHRCYQLCLLIPSMLQPHSLPFSLLTKSDEKSCSLKPPCRWSLRR